MTCTAERLVLYCSCCVSSVLCFFPVFYPVFQISDEVTGLQHAYDGLYTLQVVGGGILIENMEMFNANDNV